MNEFKEKDEEFTYMVGIFDIMCRTIRQNVENATTNKTGAYGIGVYTDEYCEQELMSLPMKNLEERLEIASCFKGVDFVFSVDSKDLKKVEQLAQQAYSQYLLEKQQIEKQKEACKKYKVGFVIGSFDVLHAGHLENLQLAKQMCDKLVVVLKTDERILQNKKKQPKQSTEERRANLSFIKLIDEITYMDIDTTRADIIEDVKKLYPGIKNSDIVAIFGSDLKSKEAPFINTDWKDINVEFTYRDPEKMKTVSSSYYQQQITARIGGIMALEAMEDSNSSSHSHQAQNGSEPFDDGK